MEKNIGSNNKELNSGNIGIFTPEEIEFANKYTGDLTANDDDFGFGKAERKEKSEKRKELLDKMLAIDREAKEKLNILDNIDWNTRNSKYVGEMPFSEKLASLIKQKDGHLDYLTYADDEDDIKKTKEKIKEIDFCIKDTIKFYFLGEDNIDATNLVLAAQERFLSAQRELENELLEKGIKWTDLSDKKQIKMLDEMHLKEQDTEETMKEGLKKIEKEKSEKDEFFALIASIREDIYKNPSENPWKKINDADSLIRKKSEKEIMGYFPDIIALTPENEIEEAVEKVYMMPGRKGTMAMNGEEDELICSELTGLDTKTIKNVIDRARPIFPSIELIKDRGADNKPEYYNALERKYWNLLKRFNPYFKKLVKEDGEKIDMLIKGELRGVDAKEAFAIAERVEIYKEKLCDREISGINLKDIYKESRSFEGGDVLAVLSSERIDWLVAPMLVYYDPEEDFAYTDTEVLPEEIKNRLEERIGYRSQSRRAFFIINEDETITEFKGYSPANLNKRKIVESSGAPEGILDASEGRREKAVLNNIGSVEADFKLVNEKCKNIKGKEMDYGILRRKAKKGEEFVPFIRIATPDKVINKLAEYKKISAAEFVRQSANVFAKELNSLHEKGIFDGADYEEGKYKSWLHASNVEIHGHIIDVGATSSIERMAGEEFEPDNSEHLEILTIYKTKDLDRFFGGNRETQFTKDKGYYDAKLKESTEFSKEFIGSFIEIYLSKTPEAERRKIIDYVLEETKKTKKWTERMSYLVAEAHTKQQYLKKEK